MSLTPEDRRRMLVATIEDLSAQIADDGMMVPGSKGQPVLHPALRERLAHLAELRQLEKTMGDEAPADDLDAFLGADGRRFAGLK